MSEFESMGLDTDKMWRDLRIRGLREDIERRRGAGYALLGVMIVSSVAMITAVIVYTLTLQDWAQGAAGLAFMLILLSTAMILKLNWKITDLEINLMEERMK